MYTYIHTYIHTYLDPVIKLMIRGTIKQPLRVRTPPLEESVGISITCYLVTPRCEWNFPGRPYVRWHHLTTHNSIVQTLLQVARLRMWCWLRENSPLETIEMKFYIPWTIMYNALWIYSYRLIPYHHVNNIFQYDSQCFLHISHKTQYNHHLKSKMVQLLPIQSIKRSKTQKKTAFFLAFRGLLLLSPWGRLSLPPTWDSSRILSHGHTCHTSPGVDFSVNTHRKSMDSAEKNTCYLSILSTGSASWFEHHPSIMSIIHYDIKHPHLNRHELLNA